jgi:hypothetical protein
MMEWYIEMMELNTEINECNIEIMEWNICKKIYGNNKSCLV